MKYVSRDDKIETIQAQAGGKYIGLSGKKRNGQPEKKQQEMKVYIQGAGGTIVSKSILNGTSRLKWLFRQEGGHGNFFSDSANHK